MTDGFEANLHGSILHITGSGPEPLNVGALLQDYEQVNMVVYHAGDESFDNRPDTATLDFSGAAHIPFYVTVKDNANFHSIDIGGTEYININEVTQTIARREVGTGQADLQVRVGNTFPNVEDVHVSSMNPHDHDVMLHEQFDTPNVPLNNNGSGPER